MRNYSIRGLKYFDYKTSITGRLEGKNTEKEIAIAVPLQHLRNFWRTLDIPLINCEINLILTWSKNCLIASKAKRDADPDVNPAVASVNDPTDETFKVTDTKLFVPAVTLSTEDDKLIEQLKTRIRRTIDWNKYRSEVTTSAKTNNLNYLIDLTFNRVNRLFALSFENEEDKTSSSKYYKPSVKVKDFNVLIDGKSFFMSQ